MTKATVLPVEKTIPVCLKKIDPYEWLCDRKALSSAKKVAGLLYAASKNGYVLYGHQNDLHRKAGRRGFGYSASDTFDVTGSYPAVNGIDALSMTGCEYGRWWWSCHHRVVHAARLAFKSIRNGSIVSLSAHMPNFDLLSKSGRTEISYSGYTPNNLTGNVVHDVMPGGKLNKLFTGYLDMVCSFCDELARKGCGLIWRPFHENTGGWFWWGCNTCTPAEFKLLWKYTFEYMSGTRQVHNVIWAYSPGSEPKTVEEVMERYPGDEYVDLVGFDMYHQYPAQRDSFMQEFESKVELYASFAKSHHKLFANTETGMAHPGNRALLENGNEDSDWYRKILDICSRHGASYFLLWANFSAQGAYYSPYVTKICRDRRGHLKELYGHEQLDSFIRLYNENKSVFTNKTDLLLQ